MKYRERGFYRLRGNLSAPNDGHGIIRCVAGGVLLFVAMKQHPRLASRMAGIEPFYVMDLLAHARRLESEGRSIIHMEVGEPDFPTPEPIHAAARTILDENPLHYTPACGLPALREAISNFYRQHNGVDIPPSRILITPGSSGALQLIMGILIDAGDKVLMTDPGYPCNRHFVRLFGGEALQVPVDQGSHFQLDASLLEKHWDKQTRAAIVASPSNPVGSVIPVEQLRGLHAAVQQRDGVLIVDEIYHGLVYGERPPTALTLGDSVFVINSFSKFFGMTGWRLGWLVAPKWAVDALDRLAQNIFLSAPTLSQYAALAAFHPQTLEILESRRQAFEERRNYLVPALRDLGFGIPETPQGAFYIYADSSRFSTDSFEFCYRLLDEAGVAVTPGRDFGTHQAEKHVRFSYTSDLEKLREGVLRLKKYFGEA